VIRRLLVITALAAAACNDPAIPDRSFVYSFADTNIVGSDTFVDLFRWPEYRLPVRFWADPRSNMRFLVERAIAVWEAQFLYNEFRGELVSDSSRADVIVTWADSVPPDVPPDTTPPNSCTGNTFLDIDSTNALSGPIHVSLTVLAVAVTPARVQGCMRRLAIHEIGHALGLLRHSPYPEDIMTGSPDVTNLPSPFDRRSIETLYHMTPTIGPPPP
jgi:predicted Zn-dependent protease